MKKLLCLLIISGIICGCTNNSVKQETPIQTEEIKINQLEGVPYTFSKEDFYSEPSGQKIITEMSNTYKITQAGAYEFTGNFSHGIEVESAGDVRIILNNAHFENLEEACIKVKNAGSVTISLVKGSQNTMTSENEEVKNVISSNVKMVINGEGELTINASKDGIDCDEDLIITQGDLTINAKDKGLVSKKLIAIYDGTFKINTNEGDGIKVTNQTDEGLLYIQNGHYTLNTYGDGIVCNGDLFIAGGTFNIETSKQDESDSFKGIKSSKNLTILDGNYVIITDDDALHCNEAMNISGGIYQLTAYKNQGVKAGTITLTGMDMTIKEAYEGIEAKEITMNGGKLDITCSDDGLNASNSTSNNNSNRGQMMGAQDGCLITINNGVLTICSGGDSIDSNANIIFNGGEVYAFSSGNGDSAIDSETGYIINGGTVIACGNGGMAQAPASIEQGTIVDGLDAFYEGEIVLKKDGQVLASFNPKGAYNHIVISTKELQTNSTYELVYGEESEEISMDDLLVQIGNMGGMNGFGGRPGGFGNKPQAPNGEPPAMPF